MRHPLAERCTRFGMNVIVFSIVLTAAVRFLGWNPRNDGGFVAPVMFGIVAALNFLWWWWFGFDFFANESAIYAATAVARRGDFRRVSA